MYKLRELERKDLNVINKWRNNHELISLLGAPFRYINLDVDIKWFENYMANRGNAIRCAIISENTEELVGLVSLVEIDFINQSAEFHIMIGDSEKQNKGAGTYAVKAMLYHAFYNMNLQRVELSVLDTNVRAKHLYEKCGFVFEGKKRKAKYKDGKFVDLLLYAALRDEIEKDDLLVPPPPLKCTCVSCIEHTTYNYVEQIIMSCDNAFKNPVKNKENKKELITKIANNAVIIYVHNNNILGYVAFYANDKNSKQAYITLIAVKPGEQNTGIGTYLINGCIDISRKYGMNKLALKVDKDNKNAIKFYKAHGFMFCGEDNEIEQYLMKRDI